MKNAQIMIFKQEPGHKIFIFTSKFYSIAPPPFFCPVVVSNVPCPSNCGYMANKSSLGFVLQFYFNTAVIKIYIFLIYVFKGSADVTFTYTKVTFPRLNIYLKCTGFQRGERGSDGMELI